MDNFEKEEPPAEDKVPDSIIDSPIGNDTSEKTADTETVQKNISSDTQKVIVNKSNSEKESPCLIELQDLKNFSDTNKLHVKDWDFSLNLLPNFCAVNKNDADMENQLASYTGNSSPHNRCTDVEVALSSPRSSDPNSKKWHMENEKDGGGEEDQEDKGDEDSIETLDIDEDSLETIPISTFKETVSDGQKESPNKVKKFVGPIEMVNLSDSEDSREKECIGNDKQLKDVIEAPKFPVKEKVPHVIDLVDLIDDEVTEVKPVEINLIDEEENDKHTSKSAVDDILNIEEEKTARKRQYKESAVFVAESQTKKLKVEENKHSDTEAMEINLTEDDEMNIEEDSKSDIKSSPQTVEEMQKCQVEDSASIADGSINNFKVEENNPDSEANQKMSKVEEENKDEPPVQE